MPIRRLPRDVAARIAAGEVVERPASVVKELVENAIDAGARRISVEVEHGGIGAVRVADDGAGIEFDDLPLAFERHATSKITADDDLGRIGTLGFRGEALPSVAAVADVDCITRVAGQPHAWHVRVRSGVPGAPQPATRAMGTTMVVRELFAELPARRKFLRGRGGEAGQIAAVVSQIALAFPEIAFTLSVDDRRLLETHGTDDLVATVAAVHGRAVARGMLPIEPEAAPGGAVVVRGCVSFGETSLPTRSGITLLVNRRWVQHRSLGYAVDEAYRTLVPVGRHPIVVLDLRVPPEDVDVNVHPRKTEVRLLRERAVFAAVQRAIRRALGVGAAPSWSGGPPGGDDEHALPDAGWTVGLRVLGQAGGAYIIAEGGNGVYLVDQHAAHERVLYEAVRERWAARQVQQPLLEPAVLELAPREAAAIRDHVDTLGSIGYEAEPFGDAALLVRSVPAGLAARDPLATLRAVIAAVAEESPPEDWQDRLAILFACHNAVRAGDRLSEEEMAALIQQLGEAELCQACSHGRPTALLLSHAQLAREFGRTS